MKIKNKFLSFLFVLVFFVSCGLRGMWLREAVGYSLPNGQVAGIFFVPGATFEVKNVRVLLSHKNVLEGIIIGQKEHSICVFDTCDRRVNKVNLDKVMLNLLKSENLIDLLAASTRYARKSSGKIYKFEFLNLTLSGLREIEDAVCFLSSKSGCSFTGREFNFNWLLGRKKCFKSEIRKKSFCTKKRYLKELEELLGRLRDDKNTEKKYFDEFKKILEKHLFLLKSLGLKDKDRIVDPLLENFDSSNPKFKKISAFYKHSLLLSAHIRVLCVVNKMLEKNTKIRKKFFFCFGVPGFSVIKFIKNFLKKTNGLEPVFSKVFRDFKLSNADCLSELSFNKDIVICSGCQKGAFFDKMKGCSRCKSVFYCDRECQSKDWGQHKKFCGKISEGFFFCDYCKNSLADNETMLLCKCNNLTYCTELCRIKDFKRHEKNCKVREELKHCGCCAKVFITLSKCSRCKQISYCSRECQVKDWKEHKKICSVFSKVRQLKSSPKIMERKKNRKVSAE